MNAEQDALAVFCACVSRFFGCGGTAVARMLGYGGHTCNGPTGSCASQSDEGTLGPDPLSLPERLCGGYEALMWNISQRECVACFRLLFPPFALPCSPHLVCAAAAVRGAGCPIRASECGMRWIGRSRIQLAAQLTSATMRFCSVVYCAWKQ